MTESWADQVRQTDFLKGLDRLVTLHRAFAENETESSRNPSSRISGLEWIGHRRYQPGDDLRYLDWHLLARLNRPYVRRFATAQAGRLDLLVDTSRSMTLGSPPKTDVARALAFVFGYVAVGVGDRVAATCYAETSLLRLPADHAPQQRLRLLDFLVQAPCGIGTKLDVSAARFADGAAEVGRIVVFSDLLDDTFEAGLTILHDRGFAVVVVRLVAECDERPEVNDGEAYLVDVETGQTRSVVIGPRERERYRTWRRERVERLARYCTRRRIPLVDLSCEQSLSHLVFTDLRASGLLS